jgi:FADH2 O2-dependent halogenase
MPSKVNASDPSGSGKVHEVDVVILGSGLAGSVTGSILARHGAKVALVDAASHPRFAIGESTTPHLIEWLRILALRFDIPELADLFDVQVANERIGPFHGQKQSFGFVKHDPGREPDPDEATIYVVPKLITRASHLYRQDSDAHFFHVAAKYGCILRQNWRAAELDFDDDGVTVTGQNGEVFRGRYLIDASGFRSPLAQKFDLRDKPARFKHHSRSMFTHYIGVKPFDDVIDWPRQDRPPAPWNNGTLHHLIERGWFWIIPFSNYKGSISPLCSVGLTIDERTYPKPTDMTADEEFDKFLDTYPAIKRQFDGAKRVREWVSTDRLQYSSKHSIGYRWCLMSHAAGFIDPLYSFGLGNTFQVVYGLVSRLLEALADDDFSVERFQYVDQLERGLLYYNDLIVNSSFISFSEFKLWNAVFRVWGAFLAHGSLRLVRARLGYLIDGDERHFAELEQAPHTGLWWPESTAFKNILEGTAETCEKYEAGVIDADSAAAAVSTMLAEPGLSGPAFQWEKPDTRYVAPSTPDMAKFMLWATTQSPPEVRPLGRALVGGVVKAGLRGKKAF